MIGGAFCCWVLAALGRRPLGVELGVHDSGA